LPTQKERVNGGPQSGSRRLGEKSTIRAIKLMCGMCAALMGIYYEKFMSVQNLVEKYLN